jgi:uncharacterized protein (TIGR00369 family)
MDTVAQLQERMQGLFGGLLGVRLLEAREDYVKAELLVREDLCTLPGRMHGGAMMAFADQLGAVGTVLNLPPGCGTTTIESKTNFIGGAASGVKIVGECTPIHRGKQTMVWQTRLTLPDGKLLAVVTQTQLVLQPKGG